MWHTHGILGLSARQLQHCCITAARRRIPIVCTFHDVWRGSVEVGRKETCPGIDYRTKKKDIQRRTLILKKCFVERIQQEFGIVMHLQHPPKDQPKTLTCQRNSWGKGIHLQFRVGDPIRGWDGHNVLRCAALDDAAAVGAGRPSHTLE